MIVVSLWSGQYSSNSRLRIKPTPETFTSDGKLGHDNFFILDLCSLIYSARESATATFQHQHYSATPACLTYFRVLDVLEVHIVDRENLVSLLEPSSVGIWIRNYLSRQTHQNQKCGDQFELKWVPKTGVSHSYLGDKDSELRSLPSTDVEAQLCSWRFLQHNGTR